MTAAIFSDEIFFKLNNNAYVFIEEKQLSNNKKINLSKFIINRLNPKKFVFENFDVLVNELKTDKNRLINFLKINLNNNVQWFDENQKKITITQKITPINIQELVSKYFESYVICLQCKSVNTHITKDIAISILKCRNCNAERFIT